MEDQPIKDRLGIFREIDSKIPQKRSYMVRAVELLTSE